MESSADDIQVAAAWSLHYSAYICVALATFWTYDYICLLDEEWIFLFRSRWTKVKAFYIVARYVPFFFIIMDLYLIFASNESIDKYRTLINIYSCFGVISIACSECLFVLRTYVLYLNNNRIVRIAILTILFVVITIYIGLRSISIATSYITTSVIPGITGCYWDSHSVRYSTSFILLFVFQLGLFSLTLIHVIQSWRIAKGHLHAILVKHNMFYYACGLVLSAINALAPLLFSYYTYHSFEDLQISVLSILATRMHLHLWHNDQHVHSSLQRQVVHKVELLSNRYRSAEYVMREF